MKTNFVSAVSLVVHIEVTMSIYNYFDDSDVIQSDFIVGEGVPK
jgi:hypothetical protein